MTAARDEILGRIRAATKDRSDRARANRRLDYPAANLVPARGQGIDQANDQANDPAAQFIAEAERVDATTDRIAGLDRVPAAIAAFLAAHGLPKNLRVAPEPLLMALPWAGQPDLRIAFGAAAGDDGVGLSLAFAGVAETGTLVMVSGENAPVTVNFLPDTHIVVLSAQHLVGAYEDAWARLRKTGGSFMPRTVNWITGPSRTADIEQSLLLGAHGPRRLHVIIVDEQE